MHAEDHLQDAEQRFLALLDDSLAQGGFAQLLLSKHRGASPDLQRVTVREVQLKGQTVLSFLYKHQTRDITKNFRPDEGLAQLRGLLWNEFQNAHLHTADQEIQLAYSRKGKASLRVGKVSGAVVSEVGHDKQKHRFLELNRPFLHELGVTNAQGELIPAMSRKWKQINKFVEVFSHALAASGLATEGAIHVADFGSGKGYLTFAMHDYLRHVLGREATVTGVELREDMVALCSGVIKRLGLQGMDYHQGDVRSYTPPQEPLGRPEVPGAPSGGRTPDSGGPGGLHGMNVMIALHACDVATDYAIHLGLRAGADIIMCSPCCHKQLRPQMQSPGVLNGMLRHGIHLGQQAEMVTDSLRALLLDACGYDTQVFEFVALEHTSKNKMILAVKRSTPGPNDEAVAQIRDIKDFYAVREQCLETLLRADGILPALA
ncbi:class I SAM-dependent methyltransferase [Roseateles toxinivorans]|uniref:Methyltransferase family protein n=1 Tax=Roseateles toxinivorans TaxID=270368 RepID=A0A4R6QIM4_9BURK|nr:SAM-dependent methyltransferase [Roseateles toxinivorans]TDP62565.1 methyltransferase family protein [Roseateles toxinivorans]